jgi:hypothetical protein
MHVALAGAFAIFAAWIVGEWAAFRLSSRRFARWDSILLADRS